MDILGYYIINGYLINIPHLDVMYYNEEYNEEKVLGLTFSDNLRTVGIYPHPGFYLKYCYILDLDFLLCDAGVTSFLKSFHEEPAK